MILLVNKNSQRISKRLAYKKYFCTLCVDAPKSKLLDIPSHSANYGCPMENCRHIWIPKGKGSASCLITNEFGTRWKCDTSDSILSRIPALLGVLFKATALDSLHGIYIGAVKHLMDWTSPFFVERGPRNLCDHSP